MFSTVFGFGRGTTEDRPWKEIAVGFGLGIGEGALGEFIEYIKSLYSKPIAYRNLSYC